MKVLITGAGGNLGRALAPALAEAGHTPRLMDFRPLDAPHEFVQGDVREAEEVRRAVDGVDAIVHAAALHGIHLGKWTPEDFWSINVTGTFHVFEAARAAGIKRVVLCSTMGVYGDSARPGDEAWNVVTEDLPLLPGDVYGMSKQLCEEMGRTYGRRWGVTTVALRLGMFVPEPNLARYGFRLLFGGVDDRDVAQAALLSLTYDAPDGFDFFNVMAEVPFVDEDLRVLRTDPLSVLERHYPGTGRISDEQVFDVDSLIWGRTVWSVAKAKARLGYRPRYDFGGFLSAVEAEDKGYYPFAGLPWWGV